METVHNNATATGSSNLWAATQVIGVAFYDTVGVGDLYSAWSGEEYITFEKLGPWERAMYGVSGAVKLTTTVAGGLRATGAARGWRAGRCSWNPFSTCFVAGTQVHSPHDVSGTWYANGALTLAGSLVVAAAIAPKKKRKRTGDAHDLYFAGDDPLSWSFEDDVMHDDSNAFDPTHIGEDFADLEQRRLDTLCDMLFESSPDTPWRDSAQRQPAPRPLSSPLPASSALWPASSAPLPVSSSLWPVSDRATPADRRSPNSHGAPRATQSASPVATIAEPTHVAAKPTSKPVRQVKPDRLATIRSRAAIGTLVAGVLLAAFCFFKGAASPVELTRNIEEVQPGNKVIVDAPQEALATDIARLNKLDANWNASDGRLEIDGITDPLRQLAESTPEQIKQADYRLVILQGKEVWANGTYNEINVASLQPWQWIHENEVHVGGAAPMPIDTLELGLAGGMTGKVLDILPCPKIQPGPGRVVLTTINRLSDTVIELTLRDSRGVEETLRPTEEHLFYSVSHGEWLRGDELQSGERLDGVNGEVTVVSSQTIPGTSRVYNLTVQGEHLYRVANSGVLVHNTYKKPVVIGEGMERVIPKAEANLFGYYKPRDTAKTPLKQRNKQWVQRIKREGREVHDIGARPRDSNPKSLYFNELEWFGDYPRTPME